MTYIVLTTYLLLPYYLLLTTYYLLLSTCYLLLTFNTTRYLTPAAAADDDAAGAIAAATTLSTTPTTSSHYLFCVAVWLKFCPGSLMPSPSSPGNPDPQSLQSKQSAMAQGRKNIFVVMDIHTSDAASPEVIFQLHLRKDQVGRHIWCDVQVKLLMHMIENETGCPPSSQHWMLRGCNVGGGGNPHGLAQQMSGNEFLFELDNGGCKRFIPYHETQYETCGLNFRVHCSMHEALEVAHVGGRPRSERTRVLTLRSLLSVRSQRSPRSPLPEDNETIYYVSDFGETENEEEGEMEHEEEGECHFSDGGVEDDLPVVRQENEEAEEQEEEEDEEWTISPPGISENGGHDVEEEEQEEEEEEESESCTICGRECQGYLACPACHSQYAFP